MKLPLRYISGSPRHLSGRCERCARPVVSEVWLELDQRVNEYHDFGGVPANLSQGSFLFGPDCAMQMRKRAKFYLDQLKKGEAS